MARAYIGRVLSIGVLALCVTALVALNSYGQPVVAVKVKFTISGNVGVPGVTMEGLPGAPQTDENGVYSAEVEYGWSGVVTPRKPGYTFEPTQRSYPPVEDHKGGEDYLPTLLTYKLTFSAGKPGVLLMGLSVPEDEATTNEAGRCTVTVNYGDTFTVYPIKEGYDFEPSQRSLNEIKSDQTVSFVAKEKTFEISGNLMEAGVVMQGLPNNPKTDQDGNYTARVSYKWSGTVTPTKDGCTFTPASRSYTEVTSDMIGEHYGAEVDTFQISGSAGLAGVVMEGFDTEVTTDDNGFYIATVRYGWTATVRPSKPGYTFNPPSRPYTRVMSNADAQDYTGTIKRHMISGSTGRRNIPIEGFDTPVTTDGAGFFRTQVDWGWSGTIMPVEEGIQFEPASRTIPSVTADVPNINFTGKAITYTISGSVGLPNVRLKGLPRQGGREVVSDADGTYTAVVPYNWKGEVTPEIAGYMFNPPSRSYENVLFDRTTEDYLYDIRQYTVTGYIRDKAGNGVAGLDVYAPDALDNLTVTDENGAYRITVKYGWKGEITPNRTGWTFSPPSKAFNPVVQDMTNNNFVAEPKMFSITGSFKYGDVPLSEVTVTPEPATGTTATSNAQGVFTVQVPYGWSGQLIPTKPGYNIDPGDQFMFTNVTSNIDLTRPPSERVPMPPQPVTPNPVIPQPVTPQPVTPNPVTPQPDENSAANEEMQRLIEEMRRMQKEITDLQNGTDFVQPDTTPSPTPVSPNPNLSPMKAAGPPVRGSYRQVDLIQVLMDFSAQTGIGIGVDLTVKPGDVIVNQDIQQMPLEAALASVLPADDYSFRRDGSGYLVYRPVNTPFFENDLALDVLPMLTTETGVDIMFDATVSGNVSASLNNVPLEEALEKVLAGTSFIATRKGDYYVVTSREVLLPTSTGVDWPDAFDDIQRTRTVYLNNITPERAKRLLSPYYAEYYVMADPDPNSHLVSVQAPGAMADRIVAALKQFDRDQRPRQVMIDARIVAMESTDLMDLGVEWQFPQVQAGFFGDSYTFGDKAGNLLDTSMPWGFSVGYSPDRSFTNSLLMYLNLLEQRGKADIVSNPQMLALDGQPARFQNTTDDYIVLTGPTSASYYVQSEFETITSGTTLRVTPRIGDNGDIILDLEVEVSETATESQITGMPRVNRRRSTGSAMVQDGGTVALAGLTETRSETIEKRVPFLSDLPFLGRVFRNKSTDGSTKEIAVFITAYLVKDEAQAAAAPATTYDQRASQTTSQNFNDDLARSLANY